MKLTADRIVKQYGRRKVVDEVSFEVQTGEVVGLLGPNGAGKTTSFYMVTGLVRPDTGSVSLQDDSGEFTLFATKMRHNSSVGRRGRDFKFGTLLRRSIGFHLLATLQNARPDALPWRGNGCVFGGDCSDDIFALGALLGRCMS